MLNARGMILFAIAGIAAIFLSSVVPVRAADKPYVCTPAQAEAGECLPLVNNNPFSGAQSFDVTMDKEFPTTKQDPVRFTDFDISEHLAPWEDIMLMQLMLDAQDRAEHNERMAILRVRTADAFVWDLSGWTYVVSGSLILAFAGLMGFVYLKRKGV